MEWQPIETAPKNPAGEFVGPWILGFSEFDGGIYEIRWQPDNNGKGQWKGRGANDFRGSEVSRITHWMERPSRPK